MNEQIIFDKSLHYVRQNGNPYGSLADRPWSWVNPKNTKERCAIASFIEGDTSFEVGNNLANFINVPVKSCIADVCPMITEITHFFDFEIAAYGYEEKVESFYKDLAKKYKMNYTAPQVTLTPQPQEMLQPA